MTITLDKESNGEHRKMSFKAKNGLEKLNQLYEAGFQDEFVDNAVQKIIERQIAQDNKNLDSVTQILSEFEAQFGMDSGQFWQQYQAGKTSDTADFLEWNAFYKIQQRILNRLQILRGKSDNEWWANLR